MFCIIKILKWYFIICKVTLMELIPLSLAVVRGFASLYEERLVLITVTVTLKM